MPAKKPANKSVGDFDPLRKPDAFRAEDPPRNNPVMTPVGTMGMPQAIKPRFMWHDGGEVVFDSHVKELIRFGDVLLALLENDAMFVCNDGKSWHRFVFEIVPITGEGE